LTRLVWWNCSRGIHKKAHLAHCSARNHPACRRSSIAQVIRELYTKGQFNPSRLPRRNRVLRSLQTALTKNDRETIASLINLPLRTSIDHNRTVVRSRQRFSTHFDKSFDPGIRCEDLAASEKDAWSDWQGFMVGNGSIWFDEITPQLIGRAANLRISERSTHSKSKRLITTPLAPASRRNLPEYQFPARSISFVIPAPSTLPGPDSCTKATMRKFAGSAPGHNLIRNA
jgi:hypothetical protein